MKKRLMGVVLLACVSQSVLTNAAEARGRRHHVTHHVRHHHHYAHHQSRSARHQRVAVQPSSFGAPSFPAFLGAANSVVATARQYIGSGPQFGRSNLWCARFMNFVLAKTGHHGTGSDMAASFASMPATSMQVGAIAVMSRRGGGHVGVVSGVDANGNPIIISGNSGNRVREAVYPRSRVYKFVSPT